MKEEKIREFLRNEMRVIQADRQNAFCDMLKRFVEYQKDQVKNCSIPDVVGQSEQYCEHAVTEQKTLRCTCCEECGQILDVLD